MPLESSKDPEPRLELSRDVISVHSQDPQALLHVLATSEVSLELYD